MNPNDVRERRQVLEHLDTASAAIRAVLHLHHLDSKLREHLERAIGHVHEGRVAITDPAHARSVERLDADQAKVARFLAHLKESRPSDGLGQTLSP